MEKVVLGLSDGVDSAVSTYILKQRGFDVYGLYMDIGGDDGRQAALASAAQNGIPLNVLDVNDRLNRYVCRPFIQEYINGRTPNPCILCNPAVKIRALEEYADEIGAAYVATGHYVRADGKSLYMGAADNDQSYMFQRLTSAQVERLLLPLGEKNKAEVRKLAEKRGLFNAKRADSRDNCFIKGMNCAAWIEEHASGQIPPPGNVLYHGKIVSRHEGIHHFTVGQRWREDIDGRRVYVSKLDPERAEVTISLWEELFTDKVRLSGLHFINDVPESSFEGFIRVRHTRRETPACRVTLTGDTAYVETAETMRAPAKGQPAALYIGTRLLGGGFVE